mmetsp:Transcript_39959/g.96464  ORF Transcript_39959/g.96464 Transcript_39959/m.96464 type:complete len:378 (-) Transcript_39959:328-1461(-)
MIVVKSAFLGLLILLLQNHHDDASATSRSSTVKVDAFQPPPPPSSFSSSSQRTMTKTRSNRPALTSSSSSLSSSASSSSSSTQQKKQQQDFSPSCCPYDAIIFDIDGTLCDSWKLGYDATQTVLRNHNIKLTTPERYHEYTRYATPDRLARHAMDAAARTTGDDETNDDDNNNIDDDADVDYVQLGKQLGNEFDELYIGLVSMETAGFFPGIKDLLEKIAVVSQSTGNESASISSSSSRNGIQLGALTNACVDYAYAALRVNLGSEEDSSNDDNNSKSNDDDELQHKINFRSIHGADTVPRPKPEPEGLYLVCKELDVDPSKAVYIGDSPSDACAASSAGMKSIGVTWGSHPRQNLEQAPFDKLCDTIDELANELGL